MQYRRAQAKGATYFFTVVTFDRRPILAARSNIDLLMGSMQTVNNKHPFTIDAFVLLPDHLHSIWTLPEGDSDFSTRWRQIKAHFSRHCPDVDRQDRTTARIERGERSIWQSRFWEHQIRDERDFISHVEYIHYNPVKHGLTSSPHAWPHSTFRRYVEQGTYHADWGALAPLEFDHQVGSE